MYTLYGARGSGSASVEAALRLAGLPHRIVNAARWEEKSAFAELERVNPLGQVPTLVLPGGAVMTESAAILVHLGLAAAPQLLPGDDAARAQCLRGLVFIPANCYSGITVIDYPERFTTETTASAHEAIRAGTRRTLHRNWEVFADTFTGRPFLSGDRIGALDLLAAVVSRWSGTRAHLEQHRPAFLETLRRIESHEAVAPVFQAHWPG